MLSSKSVISLTCSLTQFLIPRIFRLCFMGLFSWTSTRKPNSPCKNLNATTIKSDACLGDRQVVPGRGRLRCGRSDRIPRRADTRPKFSCVQQSARVWHLNFPADGARLPITFPGWLMDQSSTASGWGCPSYRAHLIHIFSTFINKI